MLQLGDQIKKRFFSTTEFVKAVFSCRIQCTVNFRSFFDERIISVIHNFQLLVEIIHLPLLHKTKFDRVLTLVIFLWILYNPHTKNIYLPLQAKGQNQLSVNKNSMFKEIVNLHKFTDDDICKLATQKTKIVNVHDYFVLF